MRCESLLLVALSVLITGCVDKNRSGSPTEPSPSPSVTLTPVPFQSPDAEFERLAGSRVPGGFAGWYLDDAGRMHVVLTDLSKRDSAAAALQSIVQPRRFGPRGKAVDIESLNFVQGDYDFPTLARWKGQLRSMFAIPGFASLDIDERQNRLRVGLTDMDAESVLRSAMETMGIPQEAVLFDLITDDFDLITLSDRVRPVEGWRTGGSPGHLATRGETAG